MVRWVWEDALGREVRRLLMRVLFLDFDGVLNYTRLYAEHRMVIHTNQMAKWRALICPQRCALVERVCREAGARVVISSSWQYQHPLEELRVILNSQGMRVPILGCTVGFVDDPGKEHILLAQARPQEIQGWLDRHHEVTDFAILDDMVEMGHLSHRLVRTYFHSGVTEEHVPMLLKLMGEGGER